MAFVKSLDPRIHKTIVWLGSSISNFSREDARRLLVSYKEALNVRDKLVVGIATRNDAEDIRLGAQEIMSENEVRFSRWIRFEDRLVPTMEVLDRVNKLLKQDVLNQADFDCYSRYNWKEGRREDFVQAKKAFQFMYEDPKTLQQTVVDLAKDELIHIKHTYMWSPEETLQLFEQIGLERMFEWSSENKRYVLYLEQRVE